MTKEKDWADRRAEAFYNEFLFLPTDVSRPVVLKELARNFRALANSCEPRCSLDM
jgi:hypothetical protein